jgi:8-oxo-dGTP pyrophosphatase MutT (NUDIX family)
MPTPARESDEFRVRAKARIDALPRESIAPAGRRPAAVAVALLPDAAGGVSFVLTRRAPGLRAHAGQWALPGGMIDVGESASQAALRELAEEVGLRLDLAAVLGSLDDYATRSGFVITPVVVWAGRDVSLQANPSEVASIHHVPLADLDAPGVPRFVTVPERARPIIQLPILGTLIHAPTAAILFQLREVVLHGRSTRVRDLEEPAWASR